MISLLVFFITCLPHPHSAQLVINVSRGNEDSVPYRQSLSGNTTTETVTIEFVTPGGTGITHLTDFRSGVTITVVTQPGEEDLGQARYILCFRWRQRANPTTRFRYQVLCFVSPSPSDLIPPEAVTKLRQKHPGTVRVAEEWRGSLTIDHPLPIVPARASHISRHLPVLCKEARDTSFASRALLEAYRQGNLGRAVEQREESTWLRGGEEGVNFEGKARCNEADDGVGCVCSVESCLQWFPCSLKYCRNTSGEGEHRWGLEFRTHQAGFFNNNKSLFTKSLNIQSQVWDQNLRQMHNTEVNFIVIITILLFSIIIEIIFFIIVPIAILSIVIILDSVILIGMVIIRISSLITVSFPPGILQ